MLDNAKKVASTAILLAIALVVGIVENSLPSIVPALPFIRLGLSNTIILFSLVTVGYTRTAVIGIGKSTIVPIFVGNPIMILYSLPATLISLTVAYGLLKIKKLGLVLISAISAVVHIVIQLVVAQIATGTPYVWGYLPYLALTSIVAGAATGIVAYLLVAHLPENIVH
ncbi:MAG: Gx transporter family protein [Bacillota bacterium]